MKCLPCFSRLVVPLLIPAFSLLNAQWTQVSGSYGGNTPAVAVMSNGPEEVDIFAGTANGLFHSTNSGTSWTAVNSGPASAITSFAVGGDNLFAGTKDGIFLSTDHGSSWAKTIGASTSALAATIGGGGIVNLYAAFGDTAVYLSSDAGTNWLRVFQGGLIFVPPHSFSNTLVYSLISIGSTLFMGANDSIYCTKDNGGHWFGTSALPGQLGGAFSCIAHDGSNIFFSDGIDLFISTDTAMSWEAVPVELPKSAFGFPSILSLTVNEGTLYAGTSAGIFATSDNGKKWMPLNDGLDVSSVTLIAANGANVFFAGGSGYFLFRSVDNGAGWTRLNDSVYFHFTALAARGANVVVGTDVPKYSGTNLHSTDYGASWGFIDSATFGPQHLALNDGFIFVGSLYGTPTVYRCSVDSSIWTAVSSGVDNLIGVTALYLDGPDIYVGTDVGAIVHSSDNGGHWQDITHGFYLNNTGVSAIAVQGSTIFVGTSESPVAPPGIIVGKGVFRSSDNGTTWTASNAGLTRLNISAIVVHGAALFAATDSGGVFLSTDNGSSWKPFNTGLTDLNTPSLVLNDSYLFSGKLGGVWRRPLSDISTWIPPLRDGIPAEFSLDQNYPNPFNPVTLIQYNLPTKIDVVLKVFDQLGREVSTLVEGREEKGGHTVRFDATSISSGIYFYRLQAGSHSSTKKLVVIR